ncbi:diguanylate cyclase/phosphodiesterase (GGDEF & EAL domains) with PAS/PAC sensor(s) [Labilithrix luteola]|uniref:diguanylate cyclase n=1 Tax=Labilithrix luteola TaxID=1391654 RepID=A0A0K1Q9Z9_9BACT|nr:sensor domain-containing diguanylate cyclase [Labilithrix luteola]AKV02569.1 diguanylate cyclase/phosphodiesterase (GGDEF & EAL domains) with PAS/PAC sensor(s) [Labilithrix luteola]
MDAQRALEVLLQLTAELTSDRPLEEFLKTVTDATLNLLAADHASIRLLDTSRTALLSGARSGAGETEPPADFKRGEGVGGWVVEQGQPARIDDVEFDSRWVSVDASYKVCSLMAEPLWSSGEVIGVLSVTSSRRAAFREEEQLLLRLLANCSAPPIERARLRRLAMFDDITMAFNHRYLTPRLVEEMERASRSSGDVSLLYMDLDHFKMVNDIHGHAVGDGVLRMFADRVRKAVRRVDVLVRRGGEEFVLIMPQTGATQAHATGARIQQTLNAEPFEIDMARLRQTVSIGVATWDKRETPDQLENRADEAMYEAKRLGRNRVVVATPKI